MIFTKENDRKFLEGDGEHKHRYLKEFQFVRIRLVDVVRTAAIKVEIDDGLLTLDLEKERLEEKHSLGITATGVLEGDRVTIINKDGTEGETYRTIDVQLFEESRWDERIEPGPSDPKPRYYRRRDGMLAHDANGEYGPDAKIGVTLLLPVPPTIFRKAWDQLERDPRVGAVHLVCRLDVFVADIDRSFREPLDPKHFFIEADSFMNLAYFNSLTISSVPKLSTIKPKEERSANEPKGGTDEPLDLSAAILSQAQFNERLLERFAGIAWIGFAIAIGAIVLGHWL